MCKYTLTTSGVFPTSLPTHPMTKPTEQRRGTARKPDFLPLIADVFVDSGYRRATTAKLAEYCGVRQNELYRIWPSKKAMFLDAIGYVFDVVSHDWKRAIQENTHLTAAEQLIDSQIKRRGDSRLHRIIFSGLNEVDDPDICKALRTLYMQFHREIAGYVREHRQTRQLPDTLSDDAIAWTLIGLGSIFDIQQELGQGTLKQRREILGVTTLAILNFR